MSVTLLLPYQTYVKGQTVSLGDDVEASLIRQGIAVAAAQHIITHGLVSLQHGAAVAADLPPPAGIALDVDTGVIYFRTGAGDVQTLDGAVTSESPLYLGNDGWTGAGGPYIQFAVPSGEAKGYVVGPGRSVWTDGGTGSPYIDHTFFIGINATTPVATGTPTLGISMETKYRQGSTSALASEFIQTFSTPDQTVTNRRPTQWVGYHETAFGKTKGDIEHLHTGSHQWQSSGGSPRLALTEVGTLRFEPLSTRMIQFGAAGFISATGTDPLAAMTYSAGGASSHTFANTTSGTMLQILDNTAAVASINGYLQIIPAWLSGYQRSVLLAAAGSATNLNLALRSKGTSAYVAFETVSEGNYQVLIPHVASAVNPVELLGGAAGSPAQIRASTVSSDTNVDLLLTARGTGTIRFGTHAAIGAETITGYITIKDSGGTSRKLAVVGP